MMDLVPSERQSWYVIQSKPRQEFRALEQLHYQGFECFLPILQKERIHRGKLVHCSEPLFSRYLFIQLDTLKSNWGVIRSTRGVSNLVAFGGRYATISDTCVHALQNTPQAQPQPIFEAGEPVAIISGPFAGLEGIYQVPDGDARAIVLIELLSRPLKLVFGVQVLEKLEP
ncbi:transcription/translation regulatory transformer protein RfaH [Glaciimonas sp. GNP009]